MKNVTNEPRLDRIGAETVYQTGPNWDRNPSAKRSKMPTLGRFDRQVVHFPLLFASGKGVELGLGIDLPNLNLLTKLAIPAGLLLLLALIAWGWLTRFRLKQRRLIYMVATESFDPSPEDVLKFASAISHAPALAAPRRASAVRIALTHSGDGGMAYAVEHPVGREAVIAAAGYAKVVAVEPDPATGDVPESAAI